MAGLRKVGDHRGRGWRDSREDLRNAGVFFQDWGLCIPAVTIKSSVLRRQARDMGAFIFGNSTLIMEDGVKEASFRGMLGGRGFFLQIRKWQWVGRHTSGMNDRLGAHWM